MATEEGILSSMGERVDADALIRNPTKNSVRKDSLPCHSRTSGSEMNPGSANYRSTSLLWMHSIT